MRYLVRFSFLILIFAITSLTVACTNQTTEGTTGMTTNTTNTTTNTTEESTTETTNEIVPVIFEQVQIVTEQPVVDTLLQFDLLESSESLVIEENYNPYDYNDIEVSMTFTKPSSETLTQYAFWYKDYEEVTVVGAQIDEFGYYTAGQENIEWGDSSTSHYRVRVNPDEAGTWSYTLQVNVLGTITQTLSGNFIVGDASTRTNGYIQVDPTNKRTFIYSSSQETYMPMGLNLAWWSTTLGAHDYSNWFKELAEVNGNMARIWLSNWSFSLHKFSYTNFDSRQNIAARLDLLFELAQENDIYVLLTLINHGQFSANTNPEWAENPYNVDNGGMLEHPIQFFYNDEAKTAYKNELRYIMARFGYTEHIFAWELFNEVDWVDGYSELIVTRWHDEMAQYLHEYDPYNHLVTTSYKYTFGTPAFAKDSLDFGTFHSYEYYDKVYYEKLVDELLTLSDRYDKPVIFGEIGIDWQAGQTSYSSDYTGVTIRQGLWGGMMSSAGGANQWWWDSWIQAHDLWDRFLGASTYSQQIDLANKTFVYLQNINNISISDSDIGIMGYLLEDTIYGYVYNDKWNYWQRDPDTIVDVSISIPFANGEYTLTIYDTETGEILSSEQILITTNNFELDNLEITSDYAFILK